MATTQTIATPNVEIAGDLLTVTLKAGTSGDQQFAPAELIAVLRTMGLAILDPGSIERLAGGDGRIRPAEDILLMRGKAPIAEQSARMELLVQPPPPDVASSYYQRTAYLTARAGQAIARIYPAVPGENGMDVFGHSIAHAQAPAREFELGDHVQLEGDGQTVRATAMGRICRETGKLWIQTALEIPGDVDFSCCNVHVAGDVHVHGSVLDLFEVKALNIHVGIAIEGAEIVAARDLHVGGGIIGKEKGHCTAGGDITCKYAANVTLIAGGNVSSHGEITNARIICGGRLTVERGPLVSGHVTANGGVACRSLGSATSGKVFIEAGFDPVLRSAAQAHLDDLRARRNKTTPEAERAADERLHRLRAEFLATRQKSLAEVVVEDTLYAGATIRFPNVQATIQSSWQGPLSILPRRSGEGWELVLIDTASKSTHVLPSRPWRDAALGVLAIAA